MAKTKKTSKAKRPAKRSAKAPARAGYLRLAALAGLVVSGYYFWGEVSATETGGAGWWAAALIESIVFLYSLYVLVTGKADLSNLVSGV